MTPRDIPKSAGDLRREYEEMGRDRDGLVEKGYEAAAVGIRRWRGGGDGEDNADLARAAVDAYRAVVERERHDIPEGVDEDEYKGRMAMAEDETSKRVVLRNSWGPDWDDSDPV